MTRLSYGGRDAAKAERIKQEQETGGSVADEDIADQDSEDQEDQDYLEAVLQSLEQVRCQMEAIDDSRRYAGNSDYIMQLMTIKGELDDNA